MRLDPIHAIEIAGIILRLYPSVRYLRHGQDDMPWHCVEGLRRILGLAPEMPGAIGRMVISDVNEKMTVVAPDGVKVVAPHFVAEKLLANARCRRFGTPGAVAAMVGSYRTGIFEARRRMMQLLPHPSQSSRNV